MNSPLRQQIVDMEPRRYARAAKRAAELAKELAEKSGAEVSAAILHLAEASEDEIEAERRQELERHQAEPPGDPRGPQFNTSSWTATIRRLFQDPSLPTNEVRVRAAGDPFQDLAIGPRPGQPNTLAETAYKISGLGARSMPKPPPMSPDAMFRAPDALMHLGEMALTPGVYAGDSDNPPSLADWEEYFAQVPRLYRGEHVSSLGRGWKAGRRIDGELYVSIAGHEPWELSVADDDVVRVDTENGLMLLETRPGPPSREQQLLNQIHGTGGDLEAKVTVVLRISAVTGPTQAHVQVLQVLESTASEQHESPGYDA